MPLTLAQPGAALGGSQVAGEADGMVRPKLLEGVLPQRAVCHHLWQPRAELVVLGQRGRQLTLRQDDQVPQASSDPPLVAYGCCVVGSLCHPDFLHAEFRGQGGGVSERKPACADASLLLLDHKLLAEGAGVADQCVVPAVQGGDDGVRALEAEAARSVDRRADLQRGTQCLALRVSGPLHAGETSQTAAVAASTWCARAESCHRLRSF
eukprot:scaffold43457_cov59-Phaeocystis_antarctica.AAC.2